MRNMIKPVVLGLSMMLATHTYASGIEACPDGTELQFHAIATKYVGYWSGNTNLGTTIQSYNMTIPNQIYDDGFSVQFAVKNNGPHYIACLYYLQDNVTGVKTPYIVVSSLIHH